MALRLCLVALALLAACCSASRYASAFPATPLVFEEVRTAARCGPGLG
jgi:hypothetical protein